VQEAIAKKLGDHRAAEKTAAGEGSDEIDAEREWGMMKQLRSGC
jgi:hypothetical protein